MMWARLRACACGLAALGLTVGVAVVSPRTVQAQHPPTEPSVKQKARPPEGGEPQRDGRDAELEVLKKEVEALRRKVEDFGKKGGPPRQEQQKIVVTSPLAKNLVVTRQYAGKIFAQRHITVHALVTGILTEVPVSEGQAVKKGDVLFKISPTIFMVKLVAESAEVRLAEIELNRAKKLHDNKVTSAQEVALCEAKLAKARARAEVAEAELNFTTVRAPFDGFVGRLREQVGSSVKEGDSITTLSDNGQVWVYFDVSEARYLEYKALGKVIAGAPAELILADGSMWPQAGKLAAVAPLFQDETGNISFRADFPNPNRLLQHGQTGTVLLRESLTNAIVIPQRALFEAGGTRYVYVIDKGDIVRRHKVVVRYETDDIFVTEGLTVGDKIVLDGLRRVRDGDKVEYDFRKPEQVLADSHGRAEK